jgi:aspartyl-tRNA(Asn)/glutamyl-tRNA(Gln) amidotransferase subunit C
VAFDSAGVHRLAHLARIGVGEETAAALAAELGRILEMVDQLRAADVEGIEPMAHPLAIAQRLRPDEVTERPERERYQENAPAVERGIYIVPRVIDAA